jgi:hypothetical protein
MKRGLLLTLTEPPPAMEEEFNAWYDQEHMAERLSIPGFRSAQRWVADVPPGSGKYLATYELDSAAVLQSPAYLARFQNQTPWSKRCLGKAVVFKRWVCEQIEPGDAEPHAAAAGVVYTMSQAKLVGLLQTRRFAAASGETITLYELSELRQPGAIVYRLYQP